MEDNDPSYMPKQPVIIPPKRRNPSRQRGRPARYGIEEFDINAINVVAKTSKQIDLNYEARKVQVQRIQEFDGNWTLVSEVGEFAASETGKSTSKEVKPVQAATFM
jgi:hypothetical protein